MIKKSFFTSLIVVLLVCNNNVFCSENDEIDNQIKRKAEAYFNFAYAHLMEIRNKIDEALKYYNEALKYDQSSSDIKVQIASIYSDKKEYDTAINILKEIIKDDPNNVEALKELGRNYHDKAYQTKELEYYDDSINVLEKAREIDDSDPSISLNLSRLYLMTKKTDKAIEVLRDIIRKRPDLYDAQYMLIDIYEKEGLYNEAAVIYEEMINKGYYNIDDLNRLLSIYVEINDVTKIDKLYEKLRMYVKDKDTLLEFASAYISINRSDKAEEVYSVIYENNPEDELIIEGYANLIEKNKGENEAIIFLENHLKRYRLCFVVGYKLGLLYFKNERWAEADEMIKKTIEIIEQDQNKLEEERRSRYLQELYLQEAFILLRKHNYEDAISYCKKAEEISSLGSKFKLMLAYSYYGAKQYDNAIEILDILIKDDDVKSDANILLAEVLMAKGDLEKAKEILERMDEEGSDDKEYVTLLVRLYEIKKEYDKAEKLLSKWIEKEPDNDNLIFLLGVIKEREGKYEEAEKLFKEVIRIKPDNAAALNYLGYMYIDLGLKLEESIEYVKRAVELDKENGAYLDSLGWGYYKLNQLDLAKKYLEEAIKYFPKNPVIYDHLGDLYYKMGKINEAINEWKQALENKNDEIKVKEIEKKIQKAIEKGKR